MSDPYDDVANDLMNATDPSELQECPQLPRIAGSAILSSTGRK